MSSPLWILAAKALAGGTLVVLFSLLSETLTPKIFAGLFSAAPSVAITSLLLSSATTGPLKAAAQSSAMIAGAVAMMLYCAVAIVAVSRLRALKGSLVAGLVWFSTAGAAYLVLLR